jgi:hypothetical protein
VLSGPSWIVQAAVECGLRHTEVAHVHSGSSLRFWGPVLQYCRQLRAISVSVEPPIASVDVAGDGGAAIAAALGGRSVEEITDAEVAAAMAPVWERRQKQLEAELARADRLRRCFSRVASSSFSTR